MRSSAVTAALRIASSGQIYPEAIDAIVRLSDRYISDRFQPDKAIDVLDETGARVHLANIVVPKKSRRWRTDQKSTF
jgi:ATP-dependent Clp protease ATP-binding subunit ClpA